ncbi:MAG TPA: hypothetical protein VK183_09830 [Flavobacterium sp.]|nr:hypothetical protein [Flavobacterium sp.]
MKRNFLPVCLTVLAVVVFTMGWATDDLFLGAGAKALSIPIFLAALRNGDPLRFKSTLR